jgi:hypothetical protein
MKIKFDFITNSSSSNFLFCFDGQTLQDLFNCMRNHKEKFTTHTKQWDFNIKKYIHHIINVEDIITSIRDATLKENLFIDVNEEIDTIKHFLKQSETELKKEKKKKQKPERYSLVAFYEEYVNEHKNKIKFLEEIKEKGFKILQIEFGDNHGHVCGGTVGCGMDYERKKVEMNENDLIVFTECNH